MVDPHTMRPNPWNTNRVSPDNETKLGTSIATLGIFKPFVVRTNREIDGYEILGGEHRWSEAIAAGIKLVPIFNLGEISDDKAKKISLADNMRYGADDTIELARLIEGLDDPEDLQNILPYTAADMSAICSSVDIALDALEIPDGFDEEDGAEPGPAAEKAPKTHTIMRFKVTLGDAESITELLTKVKKRQAFTSSDDLTNAGDALVHQLFAVAE
jgi:hypothetical protein